MKHFFNHFLVAVGIHAKLDKIESFSLKNVGKFRAQRQKRKFSLKVATRLGFVDKNESTPKIADESMSRHKIVMTMGFADLMVCQGTKLKLKFYWYITFLFVYYQLFVFLILQFVLYSFKKLLCGIIPLLK